MDSCSYQLHAPPPSWGKGGEKEFSSRRWTHRGQVYRENCSELESPWTECLHYWMHSEGNSVFFTNDVSIWRYANVYLASVLVCIAIGDRRIPIELASPTVEASKGIWREFVDVSPVLELEECSKKQQYLTGNCYRNFKNSIIKWITQGGIMYIYSNIIFKKCQAWYAYMCLLALTNYHDKTQRSQNIGV